MTSLLNRSNKKLNYEDHYVEILDDPTDSKKYKLISRQVSSDEIIDQISIDRFANLKIISIDFARRTFGIFDTDDVRKYACSLDLSGKFVRERSYEVVTKCILEHLGLHIDCGDGGTYDTTTGIYLCQLRFKHSQLEVFCKRFIYGDHIINKSGTLGIYKLTREFDKVEMTYFSFNYLQFIDSEVVKQHDRKCAAIHDIGSDDKFIVSITLCDENLSSELWYWFVFNINDLNKPLWRLYPSKRYRGNFNHLRYFYHYSSNEVEYITPAGVLTKQLAEAEAHINPETLRIYNLPGYGESSLVVSNQFARDNLLIKHIIEEFLIDDIADIILDYKGYY